MIRGEIKPLTGIRGIAALAVLYHHSGAKLETILPSLTGLSLVRIHGNIGVDLFFILSGFIMTYVYAQHKRDFGKSDYKSFMIKRFARIYPNHITVLLIFLGMYLFAKLMNITMEGNYSAKDYIMQVLLLNGYIPDLAWNYPNWSVSIEWFGYVAIFPLSIILSRLAVARKFPFISCFVVLSIPLIIDSYLPEALIMVAKITSQFLAGVFLFMAWEQNREKSPVPKGLSLSDLAVGLCLVIYVVSFFHEFPLLVTHKTLILICPLLIYGLACQTGLISRLMAKRPMVYLGTISYALYISHSLFEKILKVLAPVQKCAELPAMYRIPIVLGHIILPVIFAAFLYHLIEEPARKLICKLLLPKKSNPAIVPS